MTNPLKTAPIRAAIRRTYHCSWGHELTAELWNDGRVSAIDANEGWPMVGAMAALDQLGAALGRPVEWRMEPTRKCREIECDHCHG